MKYHKYFNSESGATAIEYVLIASAIAIVIIGAVYALGGDLSSLFSSFNGAINP